ncbi:MAG: ribonuclease R [Candidatus Tectimicrobiota bacterium]
MTLPTETQVLALFQNTAQQQYTMKRLVRHFALPVDERPLFRDLIDDMVKRGRLLRLHGSRYALPRRLDTFIGVVKRHADGYGFVASESGDEDDVYLPRQAMHGVMHGDRLLVRLEPRPRIGERRSGRVIQVLERAQQEVVGRVEMLGKTCWLLPLDPRLCPDIALLPQQGVPVKRGVMAIAAITRFTLSQPYPQGRVVEVLGAADAPDIEMRLIMRKYDLPTAFPPEVEEAAEAVSLHLTPDDLAGRRDLRQLVTVTIDSETARDFDDAVSLEPLANGHVRLGVHIADVSFYVQEESPLDREAARRGTSVYFPDRVIPMLPAHLSHEVCCLRPDVERLTLSVLIELTADGRPLHSEMVAAVIRSQARLTYTRVAAYLDGNAQALAGLNPAIGPMLKQMDILARRLRQQRLEAGSLDFDLPEADIVLDSEGKIDTIMRAERSPAHQLIEECMLLANRTVALYLSQSGVPALYRVHAPPSQDRLVQFSTFVRTFGYAIPDQDRLQPGALQGLLAAVQGKPEAAMINHLLLRALPRAQYSVQNSGHFGLACTHYTHFTSPIRRYPDLVVHRLVRDCLQSGGMLAARRAMWAVSLPVIAESTSLTERLADDAEREVEQLKKVEFMLDKLGETYDGVITGVTPFGCFVELDALFIEGLVHVTSLPEYCMYYPERFSLVGQRTGRVYRLGDRVHVRLEHVSVARRQIDFRLEQP